MFDGNARQNNRFGGLSCRKPFSTISTPNSTLVHQGERLMFDPFDIFVYWVTRIFAGLAGLVGFGINRAVVKTLKASNTSPAAQTRVTRLQQDEQARMAGCR